MREYLVNFNLHCGKLAVACIIYKIKKRIWFARAHQFFYHSSPPVFGNKAVSKTCMQRISRVHPVTCDPQKPASKARSTSQKIAAANIRHQAYSAFRHRHLRCVAYNTVAAMTRNANTPAHDIALQKANIGFGIMMNKAVQPVFFTPEGLNICKVASSPFVVKFCNITTRTKGFLAFSINDDLADFFVILPGH